MLRITLDIDDTIAAFSTSYNEYYAVNIAEQEAKTIIKNVYRLKDNKEFWENLPILREINFIPESYCTKRFNSKEYTKNWLRKHGFPIKPIYQQLYQYGSKSSLIKGRTDLMIDDSLSNFFELNLNGVPCLLMDTPFNCKWGSFGRIHSLDYEEIEAAYDSFMKYIFPNFKDLYYEFRRH